MAIRPIVITGDPVLHRPAARVERFDAALRSLIGDLVETMDAAHGVGLAAPQIGVGLRIFTYAIPNDDGVLPRGVVVNPILAVGKIPKERPDPDEESEGCLSVPGQSFPLKRAGWVKVSGFGAAGEPLEFEATGWFARCIQHEFDHLNGKLYVDRLTDRWARKARKAARSRGWGKPGLSWRPGVDPDPFGHDHEVGDHDFAAHGPDAHVEGGPAPATEYATDEVSDPA
ncbi:MAG TPA: peptide deformylase [Candidatus Lustribacter sp.]|nr:peptide deformylase [Candidatus Lustribacter sp.]